MRETCKSNQDSDAGILGQNPIRLQVCNKPQYREYTIRYEFLLRPALRFLHSTVAEKPTARVMKFDGFGRSS